MRRQPPSPTLRTRRQAFSLFEVAICTLLVGSLLVASTRAVSSSLISQQKMADRSKAAWLADGLASEIYQQSYMEPGANSSALTRESGEASASRANYDDVDDYAAFTESPPKEKSGTVIANLTGWQRSVTVKWVALSNIASVSASESGVKLATVTVRLNGQTIATRAIIRTRGS